MLPVRCLVAIPILLLLTAPVSAQKERREPLSEAQVEQIRQAGIYPDVRVGLYTKFLNERADVIKGLTNRPRSAARSSRLDDELQDFTALMDELGSNLDTYSDRHADIRASLKPLPAAVERWLGILRALAGADIDGVRAAAHSLKGAAGYLTAQRLRSAAQRLELAARPGWMKLANQLATELVRQLQDCLGRLREFVERAKSESPPPIGASGADADSAVAKGNPG